MTRAPPLFFHVSRGLLRRGYTEIYVESRLRTTEVLYLIVNLALDVCIAELARTLFDYYVLSPESRNLELRILGETCGGGPCRHWDGVRRQHGPLLVMHDSTTR